VTIFNPQNIKFEFRDPYIDPPLEAIQEHFEAFLNLDTSVSAKFTNNLKEGEDFFHAFVSSSLPSPLKEASRNTSFSC
jgi:hypothetical protein